MGLKDYLIKVGWVFVVCCTTIACKTEVEITDREYAKMPTLFHLDSFDKCMVNGEKVLYCTATVKLSPANIDNESEVWNIIERSIANQKYYRHDLLRHGVCVPKTCPSVSVNANDTEYLKNGLSKCYTAKYSHLGLKADVIEANCEGQSPLHSIDNFDKSVMYLFGIIIGLVILGSFYEGCARYRPEEEYKKIVNSSWGRIASCFSLPVNWNKLKKNNTDTDMNAFKAVNGMRFYNTILVIMSHVSLVSLGSPITNPKFAETLTEKPENMLFLNGACAIQTFLVITGILVSYNFFLLFEKHKELKIRYLVMAFVNRYIRLTPSLLVMIAINSSWFYHLARGPMWDRLVGTEYRNCRKNWWTNLLYINNIYDVEGMCMQHTWYLATDTQLFLLALIVVAFMWKYQHRIKLILGITLITGIALPAVINYYNDFDIVVRHYPEVFYTFFLKSPEWRTMYASALPNFGGYALGMVFGYIFYINSKNKKKIFTNKMYVAVWWMLVWGLPLGVIFYGIFIYQANFEYTRLSAAIYVTLQKNLFALSMCLTILGLQENIGWFLRDCIFWQPLQVLGKLTYCTFLIHVAVIRLRGGQQTSPINVSNYWIFNHTMGDAVLSYIFGMLLALFVEMPAAALQKLLLPQLATQRDLQNAHNKTNNNNETNIKVKKIL